MSIPPMGKDYTAEAIVNQCRAMCCARYEIGKKLFPCPGCPDGDFKYYVRTVTQLLTAPELAAMKIENSAGWNWYIRPVRSDNAPLILLDDIKDLQKVFDYGIMPATIVETSPLNYHVWVKLASNSEKIPEDVRMWIVKKLASDLGDDPRSADAVHFGRLAGFTNRNPCHAQNGKAPFVLCRQSNGVVASLGVPLIQEAKKAIAEEKQKCVVGIEGGKSGNCSLRFKALFSAWQERQKTSKPNSKVDVSMSAGDFCCSIRLLQERWSQKSITEAILAASPDVESRHPKSSPSYAIRTVKAAMTQWQKNANRLMP